MDVPTGNRLTIRMPGNIRELVFQHCFPEDTDPLPQQKRYPQQVVASSNIVWLYTEAV